MSTKHTPGPWHAVPCRTREGFTIAQTPTRERSANVANIAQVGANESNARLIAAAPELLAALKLLDCVEANIPGPTDVSDEFRRGWLAALEQAYILAAPARAAIAKAEG